MTSSDWLSLSSICIDIVGIIVGGFIAIWVVQKIQSKLDTEQKLKDYFCEELKIVRDGYREIVQSLCNGSMPARDFKNRMHSLSIQSNDLMKHLNKLFGIKNTIKSFQWQLHLMVENSSIFDTAFTNNQNLNFSQSFIDDLRRFVAKNSSLFNNIVEKLYKNEK